MASNGNTNKNGRMVLAAFAAAAILQAVASFVPETAASQLCSLVVAALFVFGFKGSKRPARELFCSGVLFHLLAFYWLPDTLSFFGGFPGFVSYLLFGLFCLVSSLQFAFTGWLAGKLEQSFLGKLNLSLAVSWASMEFLVPRLFPWSLAHCQISFKSFASLAEFVGVAPLSGLLLWFMAVLINPLTYRSVRTCGLFLLLFTGILGLGFFRVEKIEQAMATAPKVDVALIQGNLTAKEKGDAKLLVPNLLTYRRLSLQAVQEGARFVVWPETVANFFMPESVANTRNTRFDVSRDIPVPLLYGTLSWRLKPGAAPSDAQSLSSDLIMRFNSVFAVNPGGDVVGYYHKRILMPFGEYLPLRETFPSVKKLSPYSGDFTFGDRESPISLDLTDTNGEVQAVKVMPLICYEDLVPSLSRAGANAGAHLLINLTNDAWYGDTTAPHQHHLLAQWRAIETRRYLLRSTNTGVTAVVDPLGTTIASLPTFSEGILRAQVGLLDSATVFLSWGDWCSWLIVCLAASGLLRRRRSESQRLQKN